LKIRQMSSAGSKFTEKVGRRKGGVIGPKLQAKEGNEKKSKTFLKIKRSTFKEGGGDEKRGSKNSAETRQKKKNNHPPRKKKIGQRSEMTLWSGAQNSIGEKE